MESVAVANPLWAFLTRDIALWGGFQSPLLSWIGSCAILVFGLFHAARLVRHVAGATRAYARVRPGLSTLLKARGRLEQDWLAFGPAAKKKAQEQALRPERIDLDDVQALDAIMRQESLFAGPWMKFRKTYVVEHASWFVEPRLLSTRSVGDYLSIETLFAARLNMAFCHQLPSLLTGIGLLFTFLAILIGLSKLHADGTHIVGIQGLINGLAGKFLSSIVGLVCANGFVFLEKSLVFRLTTLHEQFVATIDDLFPRKTMEQFLENRSGGSVERVGSSAGSMGFDVADRVGRTVAERLAPSVEALTSAVHKLAKQGQEGGATSSQRMADEISRGIREGMAVPLQDLTRTVQEIGRTIGALRSPHQQGPGNLDDLAGEVTLDLSHITEGVVHDDEGLLPGLRRLVSRRPKSAEPVPVSAS